MAEMISLFLLAFAVSMDSFGVGLTYGLRKMKLPFSSLLFIAGFSAFSILIAMAIGSGLQQLISTSVAESIGGIILIGIGAWAIYQSYRPAKTEKKTKKEKETLINLEIKTLGIVIKILRKPMVADLDNSGAITGKEALLLGLALSLDAFGAGIGASLIGLSPWLMAISVGVMCGVFLSLGMKSGWLFSGIKWIQRFSFLPGLLLIIIGVWQL
ncbi:sporulation membrane protein YtaF [Evansella cellulosilytica]|uniref:Sporulation protein YtaF n=1 Tax=Evansella cellulosilytica (strain ATCC 21833 / DSM 2522 / FERM P-1141 / JCM 9156 / N-4) TaxID=649639 RepID=E6U0K9_EVAC2|nr:sporulation membrane protein YtaF [Evansella cellulosilytica]ADU31454.1 sporulation protein YtaF [Evansella cellulosilytica DSM 2522]